MENPYLFSSLKLHNAPVCLRTTSVKGGLPVMYISDREGRVSTRIDYTYQQAYEAFEQNGIHLCEDSFVSGAVKFVAGGYLTPGCRLGDKEFYALCNNGIDTEAETDVCCEEEE